MTPKKLISEFIFTNDYLDEKKVARVSNVGLKINYFTKTFDITPGDGSSSFKFSNNSHQANMWKAVVKSIDQAIDFAQKELSNELPTRNP